MSFRISVQDFVSWLQGVGAAGLHLTAEWRFLLCCNSFSVQYFSIGLRFGLRPFGESGVADEATSCWVGRRPAVSCVRGPDLCKLYSARGFYFSRTADVMGATWIHD
jgi:hypothetical protein